MKSTFYITTPLYYVNAKAHIGHAYTSIAADCVSRYQRMIGNTVFFLTGTDEHGQKIYREALNAGKEPGAFTDEMSGHFKSLWAKLNIGYDYFIRTTDAAHKEVVRRSILLLYEKGDVYVAKYKGRYCTPCETFWNENQIEDPRRPLCPDCKRTVETIEEDNYFFKLSRYQQWLLGYIEENPHFVHPQSRYNEVREFLRNNALADLCISRPRSRLSWGIPFPLHPDYVVYVWFDALLNYVSGPGFLLRQEQFETLWPADVHLIGKDILRQHAVYWPIMLKALGLEPPRNVFSHGWWLTAGDEKMSKSKGNVVDPEILIQKYGADSLRYFLLRETPFGLDGVFSEAAFLNRYNSDLANDLGNLVHRSTTMVQKYHGGTVPEIHSRTCPEYFSREVNALVQNYCQLMDSLKFNQALELIWGVINRTNKFIEDTKPWTLHKEGNERALAQFTYAVLENIRICAVLVYPFIPSTAEKIVKTILSLPRVQLPHKKIEWGMLPVGVPVTLTEPLFPRVDIHPPSPETTGMPVE